MATNNNDFSGWAIVEIMGHQKYAGFVSSQALAGSSLVRVDVPETDGHAAFSKMFGGSSIYCLTPVDELVAKSMAKSLRKAPVDIYEFPREVVEAMRTAKIGQRSPASDDSQIGLDFEQDGTDVYDDGASYGA
jgi:hypothetical protein